MQTVTLLMVDRKDKREVEPKRRAMTDLLPMAQQETNHKQDNHPRQPQNPKKPQPRNQTLFIVLLTTMQQVVRETLQILLDICDSFAGLDEWSCCWS